MIFCLGWSQAMAMALAALALLAARQAQAQPTNDNFANALVLTGSWGGDTNDNSGATAEPGEPSHAGFPATSSIWYKWTAPYNGEVTIDTMGSAIDTVLAVYVGSSVSALTQVAANDDIYPTTQINISGPNAFLQPFNGPSELRFNAKAGTTYYIAVDGKFGITGPINLNFAYHAGGMFRFATEDYDFDPITGAQIALYQVSEAESFPSAMEVSTVGTYYNYDVPGTLVTVTRVGGAAGRVTVDYATVDLTAVAGTDYVPVQGTLVFNDFEMSKSILIPILPFGLGITQSNRDFAVVLSNAQRDPQESTDVSIPRIDPAFGFTLVRILDMDLDPFLPGNFDTNGKFATPSNSVFNFAKAHYRVGEDVDNFYGSNHLVTVFVVRSGTNTEGATLRYRINNFYGDDQDADEERNNEFVLQPGSDYASPTPPGAGQHSDHSPDFNLLTGSITFGQNDFIPKPISFTVTNDPITEFNEDFHIFVYQVVMNNQIRPAGTVAETCVTILFDDQDPRAGSVDENHSADYGLNMAPPVATVPPQLDHPGADGVVYGLAVQPDDKTVIVGDFSSYNTTTRNKIARMNLDGSLDPTFDPAAGANAFIASVALTTSGQVMIGGAFSFFNGTQRNGIARLNAGGSLDPSFAPGLGANGTVWAIAVQPDGKYLIGGEFTSYNGTNRAHLARLNADGSLDTTFDPSSNAPNGTVNAIILGANSQVIVGGEFALSGATPLNNLARFNSDGSLDTSFQITPGVDGPVYALAFQSDGKLLLGGEFATVGISSLTRIARLNLDGSVDPTWVPGAGANNTVYSIVPQTDGTIYVGGIFTSFNGTHRMSFTRLNSDGSVDPGFLDTAYNQFAGLPRLYFDSPVDPKPFIFTSQLQSDSNVMIGGGFTRVGGGQFNAVTQVSTNPATLLPNTDEWTEPKTRAGIRNRSNVARLIGGSTPGPGTISLLYDTYAVNKHQAFLYVSLMRTNGWLGWASANFAVLPGLAQNAVDYVYEANDPIYVGPWPLTRQRNEGFFNTNTLPFDSFGAMYNGYTLDQAVITIRANNSTGNRDSILQLANPSLADRFFLGGDNIPMALALGRSTASFTIVDDNHSPGILGFSAPAYSVGEAATNAVITVTRTNGSYGTVSVVYSTSNITAVAGVDYQPRSGTLTFLGGQTNKTFTVPIINNSLIQPADRLVNLQLSSVSGTTLGVSNAVLNIVDDDYPGGFLNFTAPAYSTNESSGAVTLTVIRTGGKKGTLSVMAGTTNVSAQAGIDYTATTNTLQWNDNDDSPRFVTVPLIRDGLVGTNKTFKVVLFNPVLNLTNAPTVLGGLTTRSTVTIIDDDKFGNLRFSAGSYRANENGGSTTITVVRDSGTAQTLSVHYSTADAGAVSTGPLPNFVATSGTLTFGPGEIAKSFNVTILDDGVVDPPTSNFFFTVNLSGLTPTNASLGFPITAPVYIVDAETYNQPAGSLDTAFDPEPGLNGDLYGLALQADGKIVTVGDFTEANNVGRNRVARFNPDSSLDTDFLAGLTGANGQVRAVLVQSDQRIVTVGNFTSMNSINRNRLARLMPDGIVDTSFDPGAGADNTIFAIAESLTATGRQLLVGGSFSTFAGVQHPAIVRVNNDGSLDLSFNPALNINGTVFAVAVYPTNTIQAGKVLIGGDFTAINGVARNRFARLNNDGTLDLTFDPGSGASDSVRAIALQLDGRIVVGGAFTNFNGSALNRYARVNNDGSLDGTFLVGAGADDTVLAIALQPDNRILLTGQFTHASGVSRSRITRLLADGSVDPSINFGAGADSFIDGLAIQKDNMIVVGGGFSQFDNTPRPHLARLYGGNLTGSGGLEFISGNFLVDENQTNAVITVRRRGGTFGNVGVSFLTSPGTAVPGINYSNVSGGLSFAVGETFQSFLVPVFDDFQITPDLTVNLALTNPVAGVVLGNQPTSTLTIVNDDSAVSFSSPTYSRNEDAVDGAATIRVVRTGSTRGVTTVNFATTTNGTAVAGVNYTPVTNLFTFQPGDTNLSFKIPIFHTLAAEGDTTVTMLLSNASGAFLLSPSTAVLTIIDVDRAAGQISFATTNYVVSEGAGNLVVSVNRTNGHSGVVSVNYATIPGTALPGFKYTTTVGALTFADGETNKTFSVPILEENQVEGNQTFSLVLSNATGGATLGANTLIPVTIVDDDIGVTFSSPVYIGNDTNGSVTLTVLRQNGTNGTTAVNYSTTNLTAMAGVNYTPASGTLTFGPGETIKSFNIGTLRDPRVTGDLSFIVNLSSPTPPAQLLTFSAIVTLLDSDPGLAFTNATFSAFKSGTNVLISVYRTNANTGIVSVNYATSNGTAVAGVDYVPVNGSLTFSNGVVSQSFAITVISNRLVQGDRNFTVNLLNPTGGAQLIPPSIATVTITDDISGLSFSSAVYSVAENGGAANITVYRSNYTNSTVTVAYATADGTAVSNANYLPVSGVLTFTNGETVKTFSVPVIDNSVVDGDKTVLLNLSSATGNSVLINPSAATLTIVESDGSLVVPSGSALISESGPVNGVLDPNETVGMLFGLRNGAGSNTVNLVATLLATNGVSNPSAPQNYGVLIDHGPSASRLFNFTVNATNGQTLTATFHLQDGARDMGLALFNFTVGRATNGFTNSALIVINDDTNATPYPSVINISGLAGVVNAATVTFTNFNHTSPSDVNALLVAPSGQKSLLMAKAGGQHAFLNGNLTFDDSASSYLPQGTQITSGTYKPTSYASGAPPFPVPAPPGPYTASMSNFTGSNPNGTWSLYIIDDTSLDFGAISNGWSLNLSTVALVPTSADLGVSMSASQPTVIATSNITFTVVAANYGPSAAAGVAVTDTFPAGATFVSAGVSQGSTSTNGAGALTWTVGSMGTNASATLTLVLQLNATGPAVNSATVTGTTSDPNPDDNTATATVTVSPPNADLSLSMSGVPNPVISGNSLTYSLVISNAGPATATGVGLTNTLPPGVSFVSASPAGYTVSGRVVSFPNLGSLGAGAVTSASIVVRPTAGGTITNTAVCASGVLDPLKANNTASVKTIVIGATITFAKSGPNLVLSWPGQLTTYVLESSPVLGPSAVWTQVTQPPPLLVGGQYTVTVGTTNTTTYFRLRAPAQ
jgi:uncharacterized delta-60 repeat protein/uncharacterized repeat protein (TIGR01451 family)